MNVIKLREKEDESESHPIGSSSKREWRAPKDFPDGRIVPDEWYIFKWVEKEYRQQQLWSEVIAAEIGDFLELDVPPCFPAVFEIESLENGTVEKQGVLMKRCFQEEQLEHAHGIMRRIGILEDEHAGRPHFIERNLLLIKLVGRFQREKRPDNKHNIDFLQNNFAAEWWGRTLFFDALIGNGDRHPENWGFVIGVENNIRMAGLYDNGNAFMYHYKDEQLTSDLIEKSVKKGHHHCTWDKDDRKRKYTHMELCRKMAERYPQTKKTMLDLSGRFEAKTEDLEIFLEDCVKCRDIDIHFTQERADFVKDFLVKRNDCLRRSLEGLGGG